jgi:hypothetical protein
VLEGFGFRCAVAVSDRNGLSAPPPIRRWIHLLMRMIVAEYASQFDNDNLSSRWMCKSTIRIS